MGYRDEALEKLKDNNVSASTMEVWIAGYIAGRVESDRLTLQKHEVKEFDIYGYIQFKDLQENL